jgi:hypothetical protein
MRPLRHSTGEPQWQVWVGNGRWTSVEAASAISQEVALRPWAADRQVSAISRLPTPSLPTQHSAHRQRPLTRRVRCGQPCD